MSKSHFHQKSVIAAFCSQLHNYRLCFVVYEFILCLQYIWLEDCLYIFVQLASCLLLTSIYRPVPRLLIHLLSLLLYKFNSSTDRLIHHSIDWNSVSYLAESISSVVTRIEVCCV